MSLINCPACNNNISQSAFKCPSCGHQVKKTTRSLMGKIFKWAFILFNVLMIFWLFGGLSSAGDVMQSASSEAEKAGAAIGTGLGVMMIGGLWVIGDIILGLFVLFTRPKS